MMKYITHQDVLHISNQCARLFTKSLNTTLNDHGLYVSQWSILFCLHHIGLMTQTDIWKYLNIEVPTLTKESY